LLNLSFFQFPIVLEAKSSGERVGFFDRKYPASLVA
jgi:hypothetical protein